MAATPKAELSLQPRFLAINDQRIDATTRLCTGLQYYAVGIGLLLNLPHIEMHSSAWRNLEY